MMLKEQATQKILQKGIPGRRNGNYKALRQEYAWFV